MNRVYKVIWSKAKHCYVVTSEIAKSHTKGESTGRGLKKLAAALLVAAALMGPNFAWAADPTVKVNDASGVEQTVYTKDGADAIFATKTDLDAKANVDKDGKVTAASGQIGTVEITSAGAVSGVTDLTVSGDVEAVGNLKVGNGNFTVNGITGNVTTGSAAIRDTLTVDGDTEIGGDLGVTGNLFAGGETETDAKAALNADGSIKGAEGKFTVGTDGKVTAASGKIGNVDIASDGALTGVRSLGVENINAGGTITGNKLTDGVASLQAGNLNTTGNINAHDIVATGDISGKAISGTTITGTTITGTSLNTQNGEINGGDIKSSGTIHADGKITGNGLDAGSGGAINGGSLSVTGAMEGNSLTLKGGDLDAGSGTITTKGNIKADGTITTNNLAVTGGLETDRITLGSEPLNYTKIDMGKVTSKIHEISGAVEYTAESIFNKDGSSITVRTNEGRVDSTGSSTVGSQIITQYLGNNAVPGGNNVTRRMVRNHNGTFSMVDTAVNGKDKSSTVSQNAEERKVTVTDGTKTLTVTENLTNGIVSETQGDDGTVTLTQGMDGTYKVETSGTSTEEIGGKKIENYKGLETNITGDETHVVDGAMTTTVTGDSRLTAENITNEAKNKITNKARDVETDAASSIVSKVSNAAGSNTSTQLSYQTMEEMSQADGKTASYLRGAVEEKSQLIDGDKKTTIDTIAGQTNTNITEGKNVSNSLQKADQIASSVTDGTNTTVVNQNAGSLASSITDGTKANNTSSTVDKSEQLIKVDNTHFYAETRTAGTAVETLKSGNTVINIVKDTTTATVSSAVTDEATITGISQNAKDISLSAAGGTITNDANDVLNKGANSVINEVGDKQVAVMTDSVKAAYGLDTYTTWDDKGITNNAKDKTVETTAKDIKNTASNSITDKVGENVERTMGTKKIEESVKDGTKSNTFTKTAKKDMNIITDGTTTSTLSQLADSVNTSLKNGTQSLNNAKTVTEDVTKVTDENTGAFSSSSQKADSITSTVKDTEKGTISERSQTVSQVRDKVGTTTVTTTDGLTKLTNTEGSHKTEMDNANVLNNLSVGGNATVGKNLSVNGTSTLTGDVTMESNATVTKDLTVKGASEFVGRADFRNDVYVDNNLFVKGETRTGTLYVDHDGYVDGDLYVAGNIETHDAELSENSRQVVTGRQLYQTNERVDRLDNRIKKVGANAAALAALRPGDFNPDDKFSIAAGFGSYRNANAAALGLFYRPNENVLLSLGTSFGDGKNMVNAGVSVKFGRGKSMAERRKEMADEVSSMRDEMRSQDERIAELEEMLKKQSELIEKLSKES